MSDKLELRVIFAAVDKFVRPVKAITGAASEAAKALRDNTARMKELSRTVEQIDAFTKAEKDAAITANAFTATRRKIDELKQSMAQAGEPTKAMASELANLTRKSEELKAKHESLMNTEQALFEKLKAAGIDTRNLAERRRELASANAEAANQSRRLQSALEAENEKMRRLKAAQADFAKAKERAAKFATTGAGLAAGGTAVGLPVAKSVKDFADFETAMLGVARQVDGAKDDAGKMTTLYWEMADSIKALSEQPQIGKTANDIARIVEGGARMGIQGKQNLLIYAETTAVMASAFDLPVDSVGEDIGKISQLYKVPIKDIKALGDTINYLDDNALAKGGDIIDVMKRIAGTADMAKMSFKDAAALGSTFLSLGANPEVAASASNAMIRELAIANMQSKRFKGGLAMLGLDGGKLQSGMTKDATGTIIKVLEAIKALPEAKQLEAATRLFGKEYGDDAAKLASNLDEYRRQLKLVNEEKARGSMQREADTRGDSLNARMEASKNALTNLSTDLGKHLKPALVDTMERSLAIVQSVRAWAAENPQLASSLMTVVKWLAGALAVTGALAIAAGAILVPMAALKLSMVTLGISGSGALGMIGTAFSIVGRALLMNPIGLTLTAITTAATLIYTNWDRIGPWLAGLVDRISAAFGGMKDRAISIGREMINGLMSGIDSMWETLKAKVASVGQGTIDWIKEKLGIRSPSRVFAEIGMHTMAGFGQGLADNEAQPLNALSATAKKLAALAAGLSIAAPTLALPIDAPSADQPAPVEVMHRIVDRHQATDFPFLPESVRSIRDQYRRLTPPLPADAERTVADRYQPADLPAPLAAARQILDTHQPIALPAIPDALRAIVDRHQGTDFPGALDAVRRISDVHQALQLPAPPDVVRHVRDIAQTLPEPPAIQGDESTTQAQPVIRNQPALRHEPAAAASADSNTYHITINAQAGTDNLGIASLVAREIERIEAGKAAQRRSRLRDLE